MKTMTIPLEDAFSDIMSKVVRGTNLTPGIIGVLADLPEAKVRAVLDGELDECAVRAMAPVLGLDTAALLRIARDEYPVPTTKVEGLMQFNTDFDDMTVNHYVVWSRGAAAMFDTGANADAALAFIAERGLKLEKVFLTHTHPDHLMDLEKVVKAHARATVHVGAFEPCEGAERFPAGEQFTLGGLTISTAKIRGHSPGATVYTIDGLAGNVVAIVGDTLFAGSMGGPLISYDSALDGARKVIFTMNEATVLCPGHGPMTNVAVEKANNPFFPEFKK